MKIVIKFSVNARDVLNLGHPARYNIAEKTQRKLRRSNIEVMVANVENGKLASNLHAAMEKYN